MDEGPSISKPPVVPSLIHQFRLDLEKKNVIETSLR